VAETFLKDRLNRRLGAIQDAVQWLQKELKDEQVDLDKSRIELYEFMNKFGILSVDEKRGTKLDEELKLMAEKVRGAKENTATLELRYKQIVGLATSPNLIDTIPEAMTNKVLSDLRTQEIQLEQEAIKLSATYGSNHPKIMALERQIASIRGAKNQEIQKIINSLKVQFETARLQEQSITQARDGIQNELEDLQKRTVRYFTLKREVESNEKVYDVVLNRLKETSLTEEFSKSPNATIIQRALVPKAPSSPNVRRGLMLGVSLALLLGLGLALLLEYLDNTVSKPEQIEHALGLTYLGAVPSISLNGKSKEEGNVAVVALSSPQSMGAEAFRALRTSILLSSADIPPQVLLVTSPGKGEGKSLTAANLATVLAQAGNRVLLMDCDLRRPKVHQMFGFAREPGLSGMLVGKKLEPLEYVHKIPDTNLDIICCGSIPPNPSELLGSKRMHTLLETLRQEYDRIIIDSPPLLVATDAAVLTPIVDGTVLVLKAGDTTRQAARRAVRLMADLNAKVTGAVLNKIMIGKNGYYYYDYYYYLYGSYYGEEDHEKKGGWGKKRKHRKSIASDEIST
jgi:polysaccharide biosynthesis transport protein